MGAQHRAQAEAFAAESRSVSAADLRRHALHVASTSQAIGREKQRRLGTRNELHRVLKVMLKKRKTRDALQVNGLARLWPRAPLASPSLSRPRASRPRALTIVPPALSPACFPWRAQEELADLRTQIELGQEQRALGQASRERQGELGRRLAELGRGDVCARLGGNALDEEAERGDAPAMAEVAPDVQREMERNARLRNKWVASAAVWRDRTSEQRRLLGQLCGIDSDAELLQAEASAAEQVHCNRAQCLWWPLPVSPAGTCRTAAGAACSTQPASARQPTHSTVNPLDRQSTRPRPSVAGVSMESRDRRVRRRGVRPPGRRDTISARRSVRILRPHTRAPGARRSVGCKASASGWRRGAWRRRTAGRSSTTACTPS